MAAMRAKDPTLMQTGAAAALACGLLACPASAQNVRSEVVVSAGGAVVDNPYLDETDSGVTAAATIEVRPRLTYDSSVTQIDLTALAQGKAYADRYDFEDNYGVSTNLRHRASERVQLRASGAFSSAVARGTDLFPGEFPVDGPALPETPGPLPIDDITTFGQRGRTNTLSLGTGVDYTIDARNRLTFDNTYQRLSVDQAGAADYSIFQGEARYTRILTERTSVGVIAGYQISDYSDPLIADARSVLGLASISHRLGEAWSLTASAGVNRTRIEASAVGPARTQTTVASRVNACRRDSREALCIEFRRQPQATAFGGVRTSTAASLNYNYRLSEYETITLGGSYSRSSALGNGLTLTPAATFVGVRGRYDRRLSERLSAYAETGVDRIDRDDLSVEPRKMVGVGISYTFGRPR
jgi:hypothetical protein